MLENEEPWHPPKPQTQTEIFRISSQVPEVTIIDGESSVGMRSNFIQRAKTSERIQVKFSAIESSKSPRFPQATHQVPDLTILEETKNSPTTTTTRNQERVFTESYKQMLINSHEQFRQQIENDKVSNECGSSSNNDKQIKRSGILSSKQAFDYRPNPLCKYVPSKIVKDTSVKNRSMNSSSILIDEDSQQQLHQNQQQSSNEEEKDDMTFKKVASMLSEIQKLVISPRVSLEVDSNKINPPSNNRNSEILQKLASQYLTSEELSFYEVNTEFNIN